MPADRLTPGGADLGQAEPIFGNVGDVPGHPHDMLGARSVLGEDGEDVAQELAELAHQMLALEPFLRIPADHAGGDDHPPFRRNAVGIALGPRPARGQQGLHVRYSARWLRAITTFCTSEAPSWIRSARISR